MINVSVTRKQKTTHSFCLCEKKLKRDLMTIAKIVHIMRMSITQEGTYPEDSGKDYPARGREFYSEWETYQGDYYEYTIL